MINFIRPQNFTEEMRTLVKEHFADGDDTDIILLDSRKYDWGTVFVIESRVAFAPTKYF